jgi:hypothetical protein
MTSLECRVSSDGTKMYYRSGEVLSKTMHDKGTKYTILEQNVRKLTGASLLETPREFALIYTTATEALLASISGPYTCVCTKDNIKQLYALQHLETGLVFMIGSHCIRKRFGENKECWQAKSETAMIKQIENERKHYASATAQSIRALEATTTELRAAITVLQERPRKTQRVVGPAPASPAGDLVSDLRICSVCPAPVWFQPIGNRPGTTECKSHHLEKRAAWPKCTACGKAVDPKHAGRNLGKCHPPAHPEWCKARR